MPTILPSPLCLHFVYLLQASCPLHSRSREKAENWRSKMQWPQAVSRLLAQARLQPLRLRPELPQFRLEQPPQLCSNLNVQAALPIAHRRAAASKKSWGKSIRQDMWCQMLVSSQNGHEIVSIRDRFPPSTPELRIVLDLAPCNLR